MEYVITSKRTFPEIAALTRQALERHGFSVEQTFDLHSATRSSTGQESGGYSVFLLYAVAAGRQPLGLLTLYRRGEQTVVSPALSPSAGEDVAASLVGALVRGDLELCVHVAGAGECIHIDGDQDIHHNEQNGGTGS